MQRTLEDSMKEDPIFKEKHLQCTGNMFDKIANTPLIVTLL